MRPIFAASFSLWVAAIMGINSPALGRMPGDGISIEKAFLNVKIGGRLYRLESLIVKQTGRAGRLPVFMINHGKPAGDLRMSAVNAARYVPIARDLALRGYLAVAIVRRGFGRSDGPIPVSLGCSSTRMLPRFESAADDIRAAVEALAKRPDADTSRVVAIGASSGGAAVLALASKNPPWLKAVVNVSGGLRFPRCNKRDLLVSTMATMGMRSKVPSLWMYAQNDSLFPPKLVDRMHQAYLEGGGDVQRMRLAKIRRDGHRLFSDRGGRRIWLSKLDSFLRAQGLPTWDAGSVAENMNKIGMGKGNRVAMEGYLGLPANRAMAYSPSSSRVIAFYGRYKLSVAKSRAIRACKKRTGKSDCRIVMENFQVIPNRSLLSGAAPRDKDETREVLLRLGLAEKRLTYLDEYLDRDEPKALAGSKDGKFLYFSSNRKTLSIVRQRALLGCGDRAKGTCTVLMENHKVVGR